MVTTMLKGLPNLLIRGRPLALKKRKRTLNKKGKRVSKIKATEDNAEERSASNQSPSTRLGPQIRVNGSPASSVSPFERPLKSKSLPQKLYEAVKFNGPAPELINGRCAMVGFPTMVFCEHAKNQTFMTLLDQHKILFAIVILIASVASLVPIVKEVKAEGFGFMTPKAEMFNGRAAMIGILAVIIFEAKIGTNFF
eukprot:g1157.t1